MALEECKLFGESNMANIDCGLSVADCWKFGGLPGSIPTAPTNHPMCSEQLIDFARRQKAAIRKNRASRVAPTARAF